MCRVIPYNPKILAQVQAMRQTKLPRSLIYLDFTEGDSRRMPGFFVFTPPIWESMGAPGRLQGLTLIDQVMEPISGVLFNSLRLQPWAVCSIMLRPQ